MSRVVLITGGTRGIGASIALTFQEKGYTVVANYAHNDAAAQEFNKKTGIAVHKWDVSNFDETHTAIEKIIAEHGSIDVLVNNAGITRDSMMHKMSPENWSSVINTNLTSCFNVSKAVLNSMRENKFGRIINISSINAEAGQLGQTNYSAAKSGMMGFTKALARETARKGITVNVVAPGYIHTEMTAAVPEKVMDNIVAQIPVGRLGEPEEIARCVLFLADDNAGFITGETLSVNGGHHM